MNAYRHRPGRTNKQNSRWLKKEEGGGVGGGGGEWGGEGGGGGGELTEGKLTPLFEFTGKKKPEKKREKPTKT